MNAPVRTWSGVREIAAGSAVVAAAAVVVVVSTRSRLLAVDLLGLAAALVVSAAAVPDVRLRWGSQATVVAGTVALLARDVPDAAPDASRLVLVAGPAGLLALVAVLASAYAGVLDRARRREVEVRRRAERRAQLLDVVGRLVELPRTDTDGAVLDAMRAFGFEAVATADVEDGRVVAPQRTDGLAWDRPLDAARGRVGIALATGRPEVVADHAAAPELPDDRLATVVLVPVRWEGRAHGLLVAGRYRQLPPTADEVDLLVLLAAHLGAAVEVDRSVTTQRALLDRLRDLEALRTSLVERVSADLRAPLARMTDEARRLAQGDLDGGLDPEARHEAFGRLRAEAAAFERTLVTVLDFSRRRRPGADTTPPRPS